MIDNDNQRRAENTANAKSPAAHLYGCKNPSAVNPAVLAYIGDAVYERYVRLYVFSKGILRPDRLNNASVRYVRAEAQAHVYDRLVDILTAEEAAVARRGKNHKITSMPHNVDQITYKKATGFEALVGYLEISEKNMRLEEIIAIAFHIIENENIEINRKRSQK